MIVDITMTVTSRDGSVRKDLYSVLVTSFADDRIRGHFLVEHGKTPTQANHTGSFPITPLPGSANNDWRISKMEFRN